MTKGLKLLLSIVLCLFIAFALAYCSYEQMEHTDLIKRTFWNFLAIRMCYQLSTRIMTGNWNAPI
jgi:hypothetical protein